MVQYCHEGFSGPDSFLDWFWRMYKNLGIMKVVNSCKSDVLEVRRGFMEGHPASMAAFVTSLIPLMIRIDDKLTGLEVREKRHKCKLFADDLKVFLNDLNEINHVEDIICKFEHISGVALHRDPDREKCQALPFGQHQDYDGWSRWPWITVKNTIKVVGAVFSNESDIHKLNTELAVKNIYFEVHKAYGFKGSILQKIYYSTTVIFSKLWYLAQNVKMYEKS